MESSTRLRGRRNGIGALQNKDRRLYMKFYVKRNFVANITILSEIVSKDEKVDTSSVRNKNGILEKLKYFGDRIK